MESTLRGIHRSISSNTDLQEDVIINDWKKNDLFVRTKQQQWTILHTTTQFPGITRTGKFNKVGEGDDSDVEVASFRTQTICPITQLPLVNPVRNIHCGHIYSNEGIRRVIRTSSLCPVAGCNKNVSLNSLEPYNQETEEEEGIGKLFKLFSH